MTPCLGSYKSREVHCGYWKKSKREKKQEQRSNQGLGPLMAAVRVLGLKVRKCHTLTQMCRGSGASRGNNSGAVVLYTQLDQGGGGLEGEAVEVWIYREPVKSANRIC